MTDTAAPETSSADQAKAAAGDAASSVADQGKAVAQTAQGQAKDVAAHAKEQAGNVAGEARTQAKKVLSNTTSEVESHLGGRLDDAVSAGRGRVEELRALLDGRPEDAGSSAEVARQAVDRFEALLDRAEGQGVRGLVDDATDFARRRPVAFLGGAVLAGFLVGRLARAGKEVQDEGGAAPSTSTSASTSPSTGRSDEPVLGSGTTGSPGSGAASGAFQGNEEVRPSGVAPGPVDSDLPEGATPAFPPTDPVASEGV